MKFKYLNVISIFMVLVGIIFLIPDNTISVEAPTGINLGHDYTFNLVTGNLTSSGVQYSTVITTTTAALEATLFSKSLDISFGTGSHKYIIDLYLEIYTEIKAALTGTADVEWKPQARNANGTWTDLASYVDLADVGTSYTASNLKGYVATSSTLDEMPLDFRILIKCDETNEGMGRIKSGSYIRVTFKDINWGE